jgi:hypothetical protein
VSKIGHYGSGSLQPSSAVEQTLSAQRRSTPVFHRRTCAHLEQGDRDYQRCCDIAISLQSIEHI